MPGYKDRKSWWAFQLPNKTAFRTDPLKEAEKYAVSREEEFYEEPLSPPAPEEKPEGHSTALHKDLNDLAQEFLVLLNETDEAYSDIMNYMIDNLKSIRDKK